MKKWDKWKKRILVFVVTGCMLLDSDMTVLAEETQKVVSNLYDEYQTEQLYKKQYEETVGQVQPEQSAENNDDLKKNLKDAEVLVESAFNEKEQVSLRLPEITKYTDEKEVELTGLYGEPVEVKEHEKVCWNKKGCNKCSLPILLDSSNFYKITENKKITSKLFCYSS